MLKPIGDRVVIELVQEAPTTRGGIVLPDSAKEKPRRGKVVAVGSGKLLENGTRVPMDLKVGDVILFAKYGGDTFELEGTEYTILNERDVLGVIE